MTNGNDQRTSVPINFGFIDTLRTLSNFYLLLLLGFGILFVLIILEIFTNISAVKIVIITLLNIALFAVVITPVLVIFLFLRMAQRLWPVIRGYIESIQNRILSWLGLETLDEGDME